MTRNIWDATHYFLTSRFLLKISKGTYIPLKNLLVKEDNYVKAQIISIYINKITTQIDKAAPAKHKVTIQIDRPTSVKHKITTQIDKTTTVKYKITIRIDKTTTVKYKITIRIDKTTTVKYKITMYS